MLSLLGGLLSQLPPLVKEIALLIVGVLCLVAAFRGGSMREKAFGVIV